MKKLHLLFINTKNILKNGISTLSIDPLSHNLNHNAFNNDQEKTNNISR